VGWCKPRQRGSLDGRGRNEPLDVGRLYQQQSDGNACYFLILPVRAGLNMQKGEGKGGEVRYRLLSARVTASCRGWASGSRSSQDREKQRYLRRVRIESER
jgi:hypothetical protein